MAAARTPQEIGALLRRRRISLGLNQDEIKGVSSATVRKIENGTEPNPRPRTRLLLAQGLDLAHDAYDVLAAGGMPAPEPVERPPGARRVSRVAGSWAWADMAPEDRERYRRIEAWIDTLPEEQQSDIKFYGKTEWVAGREALRNEFQLRSPEGYGMFQRAWREDTSILGDEVAQDQPTDEQFALAGNEGDKREKAGKRQARPSPDPEPEGT